MKYYGILFLALTACLPRVFAQEQLLESGPMVGYSTMKEVLLWVKTTEAAEVKFQYWNVKSPEIKYTTDTQRTNREQEFIAKLLANRLEPGQKYQYELLIDNHEVKRPYKLEFQSQPLWQWRNDAPDFKFALGSCSYVNEEKYDRPGKPYGSGFEIYNSIKNKNPDFMLWLGDNVYLREVDWNSRTGIMERYAHTRALKEMQPLLAATHNYAIWDDHDYGPNDSDKTYWNKKITEEAFNLFWGNPNTNLTEKGGITCTFQWHDVQFFLLDDRYFKTPNANKISKRELLGAEQLEWLVNSLISSSASFKFVVMGGQVLNSEATFEKYATYPEERANLLKQIHAAKIPGVIFLSGDVHHTELSKYEEGSYPLYDITISPLTAGVSRIENNPNKHYVEGTLVNKRNFGTIEISGTKSNRKLAIKTFDTSGNQLWNYEIFQKELQ